MKKLLLLAVLLVPSAISAWWRNNSFTIQTIGNFDYVDGDNGYHGVGQRIGNFYYYND